ncbi:E3 ubiquitin-protein ligase MARCH5 [Zalerion maritima]|uniref:E3 ubiquitin-protein ligase MARCH5 n=1 Tax=Zalerion maritima TaxID=339359 RepID=A0AAD5RQW4_9PEZI|nr:E3 ubiquitin-protein ligase MARCH5 [Zalerion maritima]
MSSPSVSAPASATTAEGPAEGPAERSLTRAPTDSTRRCFVCLTDEGDPAGPSENWVNPCPCTLAAHHECMLMFVTDCEQEHRPLQCPICKSTIELIQPFDPAIVLANTLYAAMCKISPYFLVVVFAGGAVAGSASYGLASLAIFSGPRNTVRAIWNEGATELPWYSRVRWGPAIHLPLVGPVLVLNRFVRLLGHFVSVPNLIVYTLFARLAPYEEICRWPPSPWWVLAISPAVRKFYFAVYKDLFGDFERKLEREIRAIQGSPRQGDTIARNDALFQPANDPQGDAPVQGVADAGGDNEPAPVPIGPQAAPAPAQERPNVGGGWADAILGLIGADDDEEWEDVADEDDDHLGHRHMRRRRRHRVGNGIQEQIIDIVEEDALADGDGQQGQHGNQQADIPRNNGNDFPALIDISNSLARSLLFPAFAFVGGEMLRMIFPKSWSQRPSGGRPTGLLQQQWGRSLAGGAVYVVFRDLFRLWVKYRTVRVYPKRRVKDMGKHRPSG